MQPDIRFLMAYCERLGAPGFWAEPLNAVTNGAFLIAAFAGLMLWRQKQPRDWPALALVVIVTAIGIGSFLFHTIPNGTTVLLDVLPIQAFILVYFGLALGRYLGAPLWLVLAGPLAFFATSALLVRLAGSGALAGGIGYVPALAALFGFGYAAGRRSDLSAVSSGLAGEAARRVARALTIAGLVFTLSLTLRTLDRPLCGLWPVGLHFLWHMLNATVLGLLTLAALRVAPARRSA